MDGFVEGFKLVLGFIWDNLIYINMLFAIIVVFFQRKEPKSAWAWLLILYFIPVIGFIFYLLAAAVFEVHTVLCRKSMTVPVYAKTSEHCFAPPSKEHPQHRMQDAKQGKLCRPFPQLIPFPVL